LERRRILTVALRTISLRDFVIVKELTLEFASGFTALTGETGAGKSILIDAIQLALGARSDSLFIREGAARTEISAEFDCPAWCQPWLENGGFDLAETLLLRRTIDCQGKSRAWINGSLATMAQLRELGNCLLDIHGQHAWQSLTRPNAALDLLDAYAGQSGDEISGLWNQWKNAKRALENGHSAQASRQVELDRMNWQIAELEKLDPGEFEWDDLNSSHSRLAHAQALIDATHSSLERLDGDGTGVLTWLTRAAATLDSEAHIEPQFVDIANILRSSLAQAEDAAHSLHAYLRHANPDPERLAQLDQRMTQWIALARRYRQDPKDLHGLLISWKEARMKLDAATDIDALLVQEENARAAYLSEAAKLSSGRQAAAPRLSRAVTALIQDLGMQGGRFEVAVHKAAQASITGHDEVSFMVAGHSGSQPRPVGKVASGGELSRLALAIAVTTSRLGQAQTLIFDEVDAGIGGAVAQTVGRLMRHLGKDRQVLAVTHLPQVAASADHHLVVTKLEDAGATVSSVKWVVNDQRVEEISRMIGGQIESAASLAHAGEMLDHGQHGRNAVDAAQQ